MIAEAQQEWTIAPSGLELDPRRYLGELRELPPAPAQESGAWCEIVVHDREGEMRWTLVVFEPNEDQKFARARSLATGGAAPPVEREGPHLPLPAAAGARVASARPASAALLEEPWGRGGRTPHAPGVDG
jgi:hypothetical protein